MTSGTLSLFNLVLAIFFKIFFQEKFPPNIYYKIFTHRNIVDLCANAPRDYTQATTKRLPVEFIHNKGINAEEGGYIKTYVDCEQSLSFSSDLVRGVQERASFKPQDVFCSTDQEKRETTRSLLKTMYRRHYIRDGNVKLKSNNFACVSQFLVHFVWCHCSTTR